MPRSDRRDYLKAFFLVLAAGIIWSFGAVLVRYMEAAQSYQWHYLFCRGMTVAIVLLIYLLTIEGIAVVETFRRTGFAQIIIAQNFLIALAFFFIARSGRPFSLA
jgi:drug/metabolite transporter (DMT)-like permease